MKWLNTSKKVSDIETSTTLLWPELVMLVGSADGYIRMQGVEALRPYSSTMSLIGQWSR